MNKNRLFLIFILILSLVSCKKEPSYNSGNSDIDNILNKAVPTNRTETSLERLTSLDLSGLGLNALPALLDKCTNLTEINLANNEFTEISLKQFPKP